MMCTQGVSVLSAITLMFCCFAHNVAAAPAGPESCLAALEELSRLKGVNERKLVLEPAILRCPEDPDLLYAYAYNLDLRGHGTEALKYYRLVIGQNPDYAKAYYGMGQIFQSRGRLTEAIDAYSRGLSRDQNNEWAKKQLQALQDNTGKDGTKAATGDLVETPRPPVAEPNLAPGAINTEIQQAISQAMQGEATKKAIQAAVAEARQEILQQARQQALEQAQKETAVLTQPQASQGAAAWNGVSTVQPVVVEPRKTEEAPPVPAAVAEPIEKEGAFAGVSKEQSTAPLATAARRFPKVFATSPAVQDTVTGLRDLSPNLLAVMHFEPEQRKLSARGLAFVKQDLCVAIHTEAPDGRLVLSGHTDDLGDQGSNRSLSRSRAQSMKNALVDSCGLKPERVTVEHYGKAQPLVPNTSAEHRAINRRVEINRLPSS